MENQEENGFISNLGNHLQIDNSDNVNEIAQLQKLNVWGESQEVLEKQALKELEIFNSENQNSNLEDGEIQETDILSRNLDSVSSELDVNRYIKNQEELKKRQDHKRLLEVGDPSKDLINTISSNHNQILTAKIKKRKRANVCDTTKRKKLSSKKNKDNNNDSGSDYVPSDGYISYGSDQESNNEFVSTESRTKINIDKIKDDGCSRFYKLRLKQHYKELEEDCDEESDDVQPDVEIQGGLKIPYKMWINLYSYQQEGIKWLWDIHQQSTGGLLGDEMGLGKTVQIIVFLAALQNSRVISRYGRFTGLGPTLIVVPATVIHQWVKHFHDWAPEFRAAVLHQSGSYTGPKNKLIREINKSKGILITSYSAILKFKDILNELSWHYLILDEGHKIRNSGAKISVAVKQIQTPHRIMLTGSPMQNNLQELWSLFDFIVPGMLGMLSTFVEHFANPIMQGGYSNATSIQEATALSTATALKDLISPHLLRRSKEEVKKHICLPHKSEQVLFCSLTEEQRDLYKSYLLSEHVGSILGRGGKNWFSENYMRSNVLVAITTLRKICNHPDVYLGDGDAEYLNAKNEEVVIEDKYGYYKRSGKMVVVSALLKIWKKQKHRVLLFTQARAMIIIFEAFLKQQGYKYLKMDGSTSISSRQPLINKFNEDFSYDVFLLTTRVGGLGVNLTGANRVIIYDPDWNPATDTQARERAWRIGQEKQVTIYRLISAGTIEEKIYQRQVWKQLLSNKVLLDPRTQKFFKTSDLHDLFSYTESSEANPETANIFRNSRVNLQERINNKKNSKKNKQKVRSTEDYQFSDEKIQAMKDLAQQIAKSISQCTKNETEPPKKKSYQLELEEERIQRIQEKESLKTLTPAELRMLNRKKLEQIEDNENKIDGCSTSITFSNALEISEKTSKLYNDVRENKITDIDGTTRYKNLISKNIIEKSSIDTSHKQKRKKKNDVKVDTSGIVDGEVVEGLLRSEINKRKDKESKQVNHNDGQNDYVLEKLFSKKGVQSALEHEMIIQGTSKKENQLKLKWEAQQKTELAMQALKKSRYNNWRW
ncbi:hypothetical protein FQR65_LT08976 [Abscondita terminalis]|nr:hypothetical protein FQR65_LT08976 [Abscondita terminalis]